MKKIVVFDFDKTLTNKDTTFPFFLFCCSREPLKYLFIPAYIFLMVIAKLGLISVKQTKEVGLKFFCPKQVSEFQSICKDYANNIKLNSLYKTDFEKYQNDQSIIIVASASFKYYLDELFPNSIIFGTSLKIDSIRNTIVGIDVHPFKEQKAKLLIENGFNQIDIFYTDSKNDISTAKIAKQIFWITNGLISKIETNN